MKSSKKCRLGAGRFQWNSGGWMGATWGGISWVLVAIGHMIAFGDWTASIVPGVCAGTVLLLAHSLWYLRDRVDPYHALLALLTLESFAIPLAWLSISTGASPAALAQMNWPNSPIWEFGVPLVVPAILVSYCLLEYLAPVRDLDQDHHSAQYASS